jgi:hypothetical protein
LIERSFLVELIEHTRGILTTISELTDLSRHKFAEREFREFFSTIINRDIERQTLVLNTFLRYIQSSTPVPKRGTIVRIIEKTLERHQTLLGEKKISISRRFEQDLPETAVPDEHLEFIVDSLLQYTLLCMPRGGNITFLARSGVLPAGCDDAGPTFQRDGRFVEIGVTFPANRNPEASARRGRTATYEEEVRTNLVYRLVDEVVRKNRGTLRFNADEKQSFDSFILSFPAERRKIVHYLAAKRNLTRD